MSETDVHIVGFNPVEENCEIEAEANSLFTSLTTGITTTPTVDLTDSKFTYTVNPADLINTDPTAVDIDDVTTVDLAGTGSFDKMMAAVNLHLKREFNDNRITNFIMIALLIFCLNKNNVVCDNI